MKFFNKSNIPALTLLMVNRTSALDGLPELGAAIVSAYGPGIVLSGLAVGLGAIIGPLTTAALIEAFRDKHLVEMKIMEERLEEGGALICHESGMSKDGFKRINNEFKGYFVKRPEEIDNFIKTYRKNGVNYIDSCWVTMYSYKTEFNYWFQADWLDCRMYSVEKGKDPKQYIKDVGDFETCKKLAV